MLTARELPPNLTDRQLAVLRLVADGRTDDRIAEELDITRSGVRQHLYALRKKFQVDRKRELISEANRFGFMAGNGRPQPKD